MRLMGSMGSVGLMGCWGHMGSWVSLGSLGSVGSVGSCGVIGVNGAMWDHWGQWSYGVHVRSLGSLGQRSQWGQWGHLGKGRIALFLGRSTPWPGAAQTLGLHFLLGTHMLRFSCRFLPGLWLPAGELLIFFCNCPPTSLLPPLVPYWQMPQRS